MRIDFVAILIFTLAICIGAVALQLYLSKQRNWWPGLILPALTFAVSLMVIVGMGVYVVSSEAVVSEFVNGQWIMNEHGISDTNHQSIPGAIVGTLYMFLIFNVPTVVLLVTYKVVKVKQYRLRDVEMMSLQDLQ